MKNKILLITITLLFIRLISLAQQVSVDWLHAGVDQSETGVWVTRDYANNVYAAGSGANSINLTKRDKFGNLKWTVSSTSGVGENAVRVFTDSSGNAIVAGYQYSTLHEGPYAVSLIVLKYSPKGNLIFKTQIPGNYTYFDNSANRTKVSAEMDAAGNVYISSGGNVTGFTASGFNVVKVSASGKVKWVKTETFGGSPFYLVSNIRLYGGALGLTGPLYYYNGNPGIWLLDTSGRTIWRKLSVGGGAYDIAIDTKGNTFVTTFLADIVADTTGVDVSVYKYDKKGNLVWLKGYDFNGDEVGTQMHFAPDSTLVIVGDGTNGVSPYVDWITLKINTEGDLLWMKRYDKTGNNDEIPYGFNIDAESNVYVTGIGGPFPGGSNLGAEQGVVVKYGTKGKLQWTQLLDTLSFTGQSIAIGSDTSVFVLSSAYATMIHLLQYDGKDSCSVPVNLQASSITDTTAVIKWQAVPNAYLYHLSYKTSTSNIWIQVSTDTIRFKLTKLFAGTQYDYKVEAICNSGPTGFSSAKQFTTSGSGYCASKGLSSNKEWIDLVLLGSILNSTGRDSGYGDYSNLSTNLVKGSNNTVTLSAETTYSIAHYQGWNIWMDYNHDGDFDDANEQVVHYSSNQIGWEDHSFTIPSDAVTGPTKMRVSMKYQTYATACEIFDRGEVEDYTVNIVSAIPFASSASKESIVQNEKIELAVFPNPATDIITLNFKGYGNVVTVQVYNTTGELVISKNATNNSQYKMNISKLQKGIYMIRATDEKGNSRLQKFIKM